MDVNKGGRPRQGLEVKRAPLNMRTSPDLRQSLEEAAEANAWSLTQEVEKRLRDSFTADKLLGGEHNNRLIKMLHGAIQQVEARTGKTWQEDAATYAGVKASVDRIMLGNRPSTKNAAFKEALKADHRARNAADDAWEALRSAREQSGVGVIPPIQKTRGLLGYRETQPKAVDPTPDQLRSIAELEAKFHELSAVAKTTREAVRQIADPMEEAYAKAVDAATVVAEDLLTEYRIPLTNRNVPMLKPRA